MKALSVTALAVSLWAVAAWGQQSPAELLHIIDGRRIPVAQYAGVLDELAVTFSEPRMRIADMATYSAEQCGFTIPTIGYLNCAATAVRGVDLEMELAEVIAACFFLTCPHANR